jgi:hypothetical protein
MRNRFWIASLVLISAVPSCWGGTFSLVGISSNSVVASGPGASFTAINNGADYSIYNQVSKAGGSPNVTANQSIIGTVAWTVRWVESYPGEPVPNNTLVTFSATGHGYVSASADYGYPWMTVNSSAYIGDPFFNHQASCSGVASGAQYGSQTDGNMGGLYGGTGTFTLISPGIYESTIQYGFNTAGQEMVSSTGVATVALSDLSIHLRITKIGSQDM